MTISNSSQAFALGAIICRGEEREWKDDGAHSPQPGEAVLRLSLHLPDGSLIQTPDNQLEELCIEAKSVFFECMADLPRDPRYVALDVLDGIAELNLAGYEPEVAFWTMQILAAKARFALEKIPKERADLIRRLHLGIQKLTFWASTLKVGIVEGLRLNEQKDWSRLIVLAHKELQRIEIRKRKPAPPPKPSQKKAATNAPDSEELDELKTLEAPRLAEQLKKGKLLIVGGVPKPRKIDWLQALFEEKILIEWPNIAGTTASRQLESFAKQILNGSVACVLLVNGIQSHQTADRIVAACKNSGTPFCAVGTGGSAAMREALLEIDKHLLRKKRLPRSS